MRKHPQELGCIREDELLAGDLDCQDFKRLPREDEAVVLRILWAPKSYHQNRLAPMKSWVNRSR